MSTKEFPTMERKKIVPYSGIMRFSRRLSWSDDCGMTGEVTLAIPEVTVENRGRPVTIDESSSASKASRYSVEMGLSDKLRPWIDIFLSLVLFDLPRPPSSTHAPVPGGSTSARRMLHHSEGPLYQTVITTLYSWMFCSQFAMSLTLGFKTVLRRSQQHFLHVWSASLSRFRFISRFYYRLRYRVSQTNYCFSLLTMVNYWSTLLSNILQLKVNWKFNRDSYCLRWLHSSFGLPKPVIFSRRISANRTKHINC